MSNLPQWLTQDRKGALIRLFTESKGFCVFGHQKCPIPEHHYPVYIEYLISDWKALDRDLRLADWQAESKALHSLGQAFIPLMVDLTLPQGTYTLIISHCFFYKVNLLAVLH